MPSAYQEESVEFMVSRLGPGLFAKPGCGKTSVTLAAASVLLAAKKIDLVIVLAPVLICYNVWPKEMAKWRNFSHLTCTILHGTKKDAALQEDTDFYVINHEGLEWLHDNWPARWKDKSILLVADESTRMSNYDTLRFRVMRGGIVHRKDELGEPTRKKFKRLLNYIKYRVILTGTPVDKNYMKLWSQIYLLDDGKRLGKFITYYRNNYFHYLSDLHDYVLRPGAKEAIQEAIHDTVLYIDDEEHLDLPLLVGDAVGVSSNDDKANRERGIIRLDMPKKALVKYKQFEQTLVAELETGVVTAETAAVASTKLRQLAAGGVYLGVDQSDMESQSRTAGKKFENVHMTKAEAVLSIVEEMNGEPVLVAYDYHHDVARLRHVLGKNTPFIGHGVSPKDTVKIIERWDAGDLRALLVHPASAAFGLNMQYGGRALVFHTLPWSYEYYYQLVKRLWRQGQKERVFLYHLIMDGTIDEAVLGSLRAGAVSERDFLQSLKAYYTGAKK